jgi:ubiquinone/menaquinone biosynthesis C-methylase UbiE
MKLLLNPAWPLLVTPEEIAPVASRYAPAPTQFANGYSLLKERLTPGAKVLEFGNKIMFFCGPGDLALWIARQGAQVVAFDAELEREKILQQLQPGEQLALELRRGKFWELDWPDGEFDIIVAQAWLHHLTDDFPAYAAKLARLLKPGGCLLFINEPLSHNPFFEVIRALRQTRAQWLDESGLYLRALTEFGREFGEVRVYTHHLLSFLIKLIARGASGWKLAVERAEQHLIRRYPQWAKYCANINVMFVRQA